MRKYLVFLPLMISCSRLNQPNNANSSVSNPPTLGGKTAGLCFSLLCGQPEGKSLLPYLIKMDKEDKVEKFEEDISSIAYPMDTFIEHMADYFVFEYKGNIASMFDLLIEAEPTEFVQELFKALVNNHKDCVKSEECFLSLDDLMTEDKKVLCKILFKSPLFDVNANYSYGCSSFNDPPLCLLACIKSLSEETRLGMIKVLLGRSDIDISNPSFFFLEINRPDPSKRVFEAYLEHPKLDVIVFFHAILSCTRAMADKKKVKILDEILEKIVRHPNFKFDAKSPDGEPILEFVKVKNEHIYNRLVELQKFYQQQG